MRRHRIAALILLAWVTGARGYTIVGGESDTSSTLWWFIPAASCIGTTATSNWDMIGTDVPSAACVDGTNVDKGVLQFDDDGAGGTFVSPHIEQTLLLPVAPTPATAAYLANGPLTISLIWYAVPTTNAVRWCAQVGCRGDAETDDTAYDTVGCTDDTVKGTTLQLNLATITLSGGSTDTCAANKLLHLKIYRDSEHANDTMTGADNKARLVSVTVAWQHFQ